MKKQKLLFFCLFFVSALAWPLQESVFPYVHKMLIESLMNFNGDKEVIFSEVKYILIAGAAIVLISDISFRMQDFFIAKTLPKFCANIRSAMFDYSQNHSMRYFVNNPTGEIASRINRMPEIAEQIMITLLVLIMPIFTTIMISTAFLFSINFIFGAIWLVWFIFHISLTFMFMRKYSKLAGRHFASISMLSGKIVDTLMNISSVKLFSRHNYEFKKLQEYQTVEVDNSYAVHRYRMFIKTILNLASTTLIFSMVYVSISSWQKDLISLADLVLILSYLRLMGLVWYLGENIVVIFGHIGASKDSLSLIREPHKVKDIENAKPMKIKEGEINFENVCFQYGKNKLLFEDFSLDIPPKQKIGLVGFSGSGKTTFINLILRYFDIMSGKIKIDGVDIAKVQQNSLRSQISVIPQDPTLFNRSIMENIRYGKLDASDEEVYEAAEKAFAHEFIMELSSGYDSVIGEKSVNLSGGQKQRIAIARAFLKDSPILILDEATASLDSFTEGVISNALEGLMANKTVIVVAHRIATLLNMDRILAFDRGKVVEDATHDELIAKKGYYYQLWSRQSNGFIPEE